MLESNAINILVQNIDYKRKLQTSFLKKRIDNYFYSFNASKAKFLGEILESNIGTKTDGIPFSNRKSILSKSKSVSTAGPKLSRKV